MLIYLALFMMYRQNTNQSVLFYRYSLMSTDVSHLLVLSVCPGSITAKNIAQRVVNERLAACCNIIADVRSYFRWANKLDNADEYLLMIKTTVDAYPALEKKIKDMHPYELPEIIAVPVHTGLAGYLDWIIDNTEA